MKWTDDLPSEEGYFWIKTSHGFEYIDYVSHDSDEGWCVWVDGDPVSLDLFDYQYAGPIESPES